MIDLVDNQRSVELSKSEIEDFSISISRTNQVPPIIILLKQIGMENNVPSFFIRESMILQFSDNLI